MTTNTADAPTGERESGPTVTPVPASLPPQAASSPPDIHRDRHRSGSVWAPRVRPTHRSVSTVERAREEHRLEEARHIRSLARVVALACVEAELGLRPARQLSAWLDLSTYGKMVRRADLAQRIRPSSEGSAAPMPQALGARCCAAGEGVYEASATIQLPDRVRAMALRIEKHRTRWRVTALELG
ncbi:Rv3235 family protein [Citricoccus sp. GCM10030269]|uniref:Rv3235 family protein n=1 Tax=Citricoccus sp. GCM10030269 TaxID=3273388 RepID=UPI00361B6642